MGYYRGDYTGYYGGMRGDPGFFSSLVGIGKSLLGLSPAGTAIRTVGTIGGVAATGGSIIKRVGAGISRHPVLTAAGAAGVGLAAGGEGGRLAAAAGAACPKGFHPCKSHRGCKRGPCVRNRRMRVTNPRALRRAIHRATGFARLARKVLRFTSPRAPKGHAYFKHRKRKK